MGCDIHMMAEWGYESESEGGTRWVAVTDPIFSNSYYNEDKPISTWNYPYHAEPYNGRNYRLFSKLADVRNMSQRENSALDAIFGGSRSAVRDRIEPLAVPRGVPMDASKKWRKYVKKWGVDLHSMSYFTLAELEKFVEEGRFNDTIVERGWIKLDQYIELRETGKTPDSWSGGVGGPNIVNLDTAEAAAMSLEQLKARLAEDKKRAEELVNFNPYFARTYVLAEWVETYNEENAYREFMRTIRELRERLYSEERTDADHIRIVFGFDN